LQELKAIEAALKNEEFRKLLSDYAQELQDPGQRKVNGHS
jgi:hypothetical protein